jgi:glucose/arabinose dehydrogenase
LLWLAVGLLSGALFMSACSAPSAATPAPQAATAVPAEAEPVATAAEAAQEESQEEAVAEPTQVTEEAALPTGTPQAEEETGAETEEDRVAAPTFDPAVNQVGVQPFLEGFNQPLFLTHAGDESGRIFVVEKEGTIRIVAEGATVDGTFLDISDRVTTGGNEQGLLGLAFPPNCAESGYFFVNYTNLSGDTIISRFQVDPANGDAADAGSEFLVMEIDQPARTHNGGMLAFGPDGYLWIGTGDGGGGGDTYGNGQNPSSLLGKMLRIDVTSDPSVPYVVPADNPWISADWNGADVLDEVWAIGLRNPWRYSFDRFTGDLWIADVGQNVYEEVNYTVMGTPGGLNYGWPIMEGQHCFSGDNCDQSRLELPVAEYDHSKGCSITGGYVYRGDAYPMLRGVYIFADYCSGIFWATVPNPDGTWNTTEMVDTDVLVSSFGEDENGELYVTDLNTGVIYQVTGQ